MFDKASPLRRCQYKFANDKLAYLLKQVAGADTTLGCDRLKTLLLDDYPTLYTIAEATSRRGQRNYLRVVKANLVLVVMGHKPVKSCVTVVVKDRRIREPVLEVPDDFAHGLQYVTCHPRCVEGHHRLAGTVIQAHHSLHQTIG
jgi:hypothetical protein